MIKKLVVMLFMCLLIPINSLKSEFYFNDYIDSSLNYNSSAKDFDQNSNNADLRLDNRAVLGYKKGGFKVETHLLTSVSNFSNPVLQIPVDLVIEDDRYSLFNLTSTKYNNNSTLVNRIDRLNISYTGQNYNFALGRTTLTWSRGRTFHVTDFFNPQTPGFYDGQYKLGTDLAHFSYLFSQNHSATIAFNPKRDHETGALTAKDTNAGFRYLFSNENVDISFILGQYLRDTVIATGFSTGFIYSSVLRADVAVYKPYEDRSQNFVASVVGLEKSLFIGNTFANIFAEYYYNGLGNNNIQSINDINASMVRRLMERDTYLLSKNYLSLGTSVELGSYFFLNYSNIISLKDLSAFHFVGASYNYSNRTDIALSVGIPYGYKNEEFGKIYQEETGKYIGMGALVLLGLSYAI